MRHQAGTLVIAAISTVVLAAPSAVAADSTFGGTDAPTIPCSSGLTLFQTTSPGSSYAAPVDGVITSWRTRGGPTPSVVTLTLGRGPASALTVLARSTPLSVPAGEVASQPVRIPAEAGDYLGTHLGSGGSCAVMVEAPYGLAVYVGELPLGGAGAPASVGNGLKLDVAATLEPDADGDGYGDTTQDACPTDVSTHTACGGATAPQTRIKNVKADRLKGRATRAKVTVAFTADVAATFRCSVDRAVFQRCSSPLVRRLGAGRHTVRVRAVDAAGTTDASAAVARVTVKRAR